MNDVSFDGGVALLSPSGWGNLGDAAIVDSLIHALRTRRPGAPLVGLTLNPRDTVARHGVPAFTCSGFSFGDYGVTEAVPFASDVSDASERAEQRASDRTGEGGRRASLRGLVRATPGVSQLWSAARVLRGDIRHRRLLSRPTGRLRDVVVAGGGQLDDFWGGTFGHPYVLFRWARRARAVGARFVVLSVGTGTLSTPLSRFFVRSALSAASYRSFRDEGSRALVGDRSVEHDPVVPDLAYGLPVPALSTTAKPRARPTVGMSPIAHCDPRVGPVRDAARYRAYITRLAGVAIRLLESDHDLVFYGTDGADIAPAADLRAAIAEAVSPVLLSRISTPRVTSLDELFRALSEIDVVVASRLHGVLLPHLAAVPVVALSYERKVRTLMATMGHEEYCDEIEDFEPENVARTVTALLLKRDCIKADIAARVDGFRREVDGQYDLVFGKAGRGP